MPCVCLSNTFHHWQTLKAQEPTKVKRTFRFRLPSLRKKVKPAKDIAARGLFSDSKVLQVPHPPRRRIVNSSTPVRPAATLSAHPTRSELINAESQLGSVIFGPIPAGHRREFFHDQDNIWIWHEDWSGQDQTRHQLTVRYEVRASGVYKKISTGKYFRLEGDELNNFRKATRAYLYMVKRYLYNRSAQPAKA